MITDANTNAHIPTAWLTDRSRLELGTDHCQMARFWKYHYGGYGIDLARPALDPWIGIAVHDVLATTLEKMVKPPDVAVVNLIRDQSNLWVPRFDTLCTKRKENAHTKAEASWLTRTLALGWWWMFGSWLAENFEIVAIEREFTMDLDDGRIKLMSRPDLVLRDRKTKRLAILDWKTMSSFDPIKTTRGYAESVQMALLTAVVEENLGEPVDTYWIAGMVKGSKKKFEKDGNETPERRFYSHLCYASAPKAPFFNEWSTKGYWYHKAPVWEHMDAEAWIALLAKTDAQGAFLNPTLRETFPMMGPFQRQTHMVPQAIRQLVGTENRVINGLWQLSQAAEDAYWPTLDATFDRSYGNCTSFYGEECPFNTLCFGLPGSDDPIGSRLYQIRRPHHAPELHAMAAAGVPVPREAWEPDVVAATAKTT